MDPVWLLLGGFVATVAIIIIWLTLTYNGFVRLRNIAKEAWAQIDVQLHRRHDLIPNLVETVRGYATHEKTTLENVIQARSQAVRARGVAEQARAEQGLSEALGRLMLVVEQYPELKANENFLSLQEELVSTENRVGFARQHYNDTVRQYNTKIQSLPANIVAGVFAFREESFFEVQDQRVRQAPRVQFA